MPGHLGAGLVPKVVSDKLQAEGHLVDDGVVVGAGLVVHAPAGINEFQLFFVD